MPESHIQYVTVNSGQTVSGNIALAAANRVGLLVPAIDSAELIIEGNFDTASAGYLPVIHMDASSSFNWPISAGSAAVNITEAAVFPNARVSLGVAQTDVRTLTIIAWPIR